MSHIVQIKTQVRDRAAVNAACQRLHLPEPIEGPTKLFSSTVTGLAVQLPGLAEMGMYLLACSIAVHPD